MKSNFLKIFFALVFFNILNINLLLAEIVTSIKIEGNKRISNKTIEIFSDVTLNEDLSNEDLNKILKNLYDTNFFKDIRLQLEENILIITVDENPIIQNIYYTGIKANRLLDKIKENSLIKARNSFNEVFLKKKDLDYKFY